MDKLWKSWERKIADYVGGERVPITGRQRGSAPDIKHNWLSIEVKQRKKIAELLKDAMRQAEASAGPRQLPVVILVETGSKVGDAFIFCRLSDFKDHWL